MKAPISLADFPSKQSLQKCRFTWIAAFVVCNCLVCGSVATAEIIVGVFIGNGEGLRVLPMPSYGLG